jgi:hypothetical protein
MKVVTVNGTTYLATLEETEAGIVLQDAMVIPASGPGQNEVMAYYKAINLGSLNPVSFGGSGISYSVQPIGDDVVMFCKIADLAIEQAKKVALKNVENAEFSSVLGKL